MYTNVLIVLKWQTLCAVHVAYKCSCMSALKLFLYIYAHRPSHARQRTVTLCLHAEGCLRNAGVGVVNRVGGVRSMLTKCSKFTLEEEYGRSMALRELLMKNTTITKNFCNKKLSRISQILECHESEIQHCSCTCEKAWLCKTSSRVDTQAMPHSAQSAFFRNTFFREMLLHDVLRKFLVVQYI